MEGIFWVLLVKEKEKSNPTSNFLRVLSFWPKKCIRSPIYFVRILVSFIYFFYNTFFNDLNYIFDNIDLVFLKSFNFPYQKPKNMSKNYKSYYMINNFSFSYQKIYRSCSCKVSEKTPLLTYWIRPMSLQLGNGFGNE